MFFMHRLTKMVGILQHFYELGRRCMRDAIFKDRQCTNFRERLDRRRWADDLSLMILLPVVGLLSANI